MLFSPVRPAQFQKILLCMTQIGSFPTAHGDFPARLSFQPEIDNPRSCLCKNPRQQGTAYLSQDHAVFTDIAAGGKEHLFKCLPEEGVKAELYWENKTTRILMLHQLSTDPDDLTQEKYYLHVEPKQ